MGRIIKSEGKARKVLYTLVQNKEIIYVGGSYECSDWLGVSQERIPAAIRENLPIFGKVIVRHSTEEEIHLGDFEEDYTTYLENKHTHTTKKELLHKIMTTRDYNHYKGMPHRYKDASCVRFTPL